MFLKNLPYDGFGSCSAAFHIFQALHSTQKAQFNQAAESVFHEIYLNHMITVKLNPKEETSCK